MYLLIYFEHCPFKFLICKSVAILLINIMIDWHLGVDEKVYDLHEVVKFKSKTLVYQMMTNKIWCYFIYM
jgi:hypothetical protein